MSRTRTHYEVLGVTEDATIEQIRRAYRALVRRHHPDHLGSGTADPVAKAAAELRMRELNEAWRELRDPQRRARYDRHLPGHAATVEYSPYPPGTEPEPSAGFAEWYADAPSRGRAARQVTRTPGPARPFRLRLLIGLGVIMLAGIMLIVFLAGSSEHGIVPAVGRGQCVRIESGPQAIEVPCSQPNDGQVGAQVAVPGECPNGATARRLSADDTQLTCLEPAGR